MSINPQDTDAYNHRGLAYAAQGNYEQAIADYNKAIQINPRYLYAYYNRGDVYLNQGQCAQAIADYDKVIQINPEHIQAYHHHGLAYYLQRHYEQAIAYFSKALSWIHSMQMHTTIADLHLKHWKSKKRQMLILQSPKIWVENKYFQYKSNQSQIYTLPLPLQSLRVYVS